MKTLKAFRYFVDSEGYMFVQVDDLGKGAILDEDGNFLGSLPPHVGEWASRILSEINPTCFTEHFIKHVAKSDKEVMKDIVRDIKYQQTSARDAEKESVPKAVMTAVKERIALLERKIPEYRYNVGAFIKDECEKYGVVCVEPKDAFMRTAMSKYPAIIKDMEIELAELKRFAAK